MVSVVVPTYNEQGNIKNLISLIAKSLKRIKDYEIVVIDDHSTDGTWGLLNDLASKYPLKISQKIGKKGKAYSLLQGFQIAQGEILAMIDADLQYPPQVIPEMAEQISDQVDIVVANRKNYQDSFFRKILSRGFKSVFGKLLFDLNCDVQSGLKVFKREVLETVKFAPASGWAFDLEFLSRAKKAGFSIKNIDITFSPRTNGRSSIAKLLTIIELSTNAIRVKIRTIPPLAIPPKFSNSMQWAGVGFNNRRYITHTTLTHRESALQGLVTWQKLVIFTVLAATAFGFLKTPLATGIILVSILSTAYFLDMIFNLFLILKSLHFPPEIKALDDELSTINDEQLPIYTILCPLYRESHVLPQFLKAIDSLDWPKNKLDVLLLLEEDDQETIEEAERLDLPAYVKTVVVPNSVPKTKPKASNYGLSFARGEFLVIYDAEDIPDPLQLKKAYLAFKKVPANVVCLQAKLNYYNPHQNFLTRLFTAEYSLWFDIILPGLQSINTAIPLGGTSNHFRTEDLIKLEGWDPFNVTEDADLGVRLFKLGYKTAIIDSTTLEEANSRPKNWLRQRSRWIKGYLQTFLVHNRNPLSFVKNHDIHALIFQLVVGGKIAFMFINPFLWIATIAYFAANSLVGEAIESLYPVHIFYMAAASLVFGNFLHLYYYMIGCAKRGQWSLVKYVFLIPFYWLGVSFAAVIALYQLIVKPHYWEKTIHGYHLAKPPSKIILIPRPAIANIKVNLARSNIASGGLLVFATITANFFNFAYNAYLGRRVSLEEFGLVSLVGSFLYLSSIPIGALGKTITHRSAFLLGKYESQAKGFWSYFRKRVFFISLAITAIWLIFSPILTIFFRSDSLEPFIIFAPVWIIGVVSSVDTGYLTGTLKFKILALLTVCEAALRFFLSLALVEIGLPQFVYAAIPASMLITFSVGWAYISTIRETKAISKKTIIKFPTKFYLTSILTKISTVSYLSFDVILAKHFLSPKEAGEYALLALVGKMIFFIGSLFSQFINPVVSREIGANRSSKSIFYKLFLATGAISLTSYLAVGLFGFITAPILFGSKASSIIYLLPSYGLAMLCFSLGSSLVTFYQVRKKYLLTLISFIIAIAQVAGIFIYHQDLNQIVAVMNTVGVTSLVVMVLLHFAYYPLTAFAQNILDFFGIFSLEIKNYPIATDRLRILIFNWRDIRHVWAGGAEVYIHQIAKDLVKKGNKVTIFCGNDGKSRTVEFIDGVQIIRHGGFYTVYAWAFVYYLLKFRGSFDIVVDSANGIPFFTPLYARLPIIGLIHHIHQEIFRAHLAYPLAQLARFLEAQAMPFIYKNIKFITVSNSSKAAIEEIGLGKVYQTDVVTPGVDLQKFKPSEKSPNPQVIYLGRLKPYKSIETAIFAIAEVVKKIPNLTFKIAGDGESRPTLESLVAKLDLQNVIEFMGKVTERQKADLLSRAWVMVQPSTMEGWGITAIEANACGTPVVAADVPGLRESVKNPHSGILVTAGDTKQFAQKIEEILVNNRLRKSLEKGSLIWSKNFSWQKSASNFHQIIIAHRQKSKVLRNIVAVEGN